MFLVNNLDFSIPNSLIRSFFRDNTNVYVYEPQVHESDKKYSDKWEYHPIKIEFLY